MFCPPESRIWISRSTGEPIRALAPSSQNTSPRRASIASQCCASPATQLTADFARDLDSQCRRRVGVVVFDPGDRHVGQTDEHRGGTLRELVGEGTRRCLRRAQCHAAERGVRRGRVDGDLDAAVQREGLPGTAFVLEGYGGDLAGRGPLQVPTVKGDACGASGFHDTGNCERGPGARCRAPAGRSGLPRKSRSGRAP